MDNTKPTWTSTALLCPLTMALALAGLAGCSSLDDGSFDAGGLGSGNGAETGDADTEGAETGDPATATVIPATATAMAATATATGVISTAAWAAA